MHDSLFCTQATDGQLKDQDIRDDINASNVIINFLLFFNRLFKVFITFSSLLFFAVVVKKLNHCIWSYFAHVQNYL